MPAWLERARKVEEEIEMERVINVLASSGAIVLLDVPETDREAARAFVSKWSCSYCGALNSGERCSNCGAEEVGV